MKPWRLGRVKGPMLQNQAQVIANRMMGPKHDIAVHIGGGIEFENLDGEKEIGTVEGFEGVGPETMVRYRVAFKGPSLSNYHKGRADEEDLLRNKRIAGHLLQHEVIDSNIELKVSPACLLIVSDCLMDVCVF